VGLGVWADLGRKLAHALQVAVVWEDREWFRIDQPREDTVALIQQFLLRERQWRDPHVPERPRPGAPLESFIFDYAVDLGGYAAVHISIGGRETKWNVWGMRDSLAHLADAVLQLTAGRAEDSVVFDLDAPEGGECLVEFRRSGAAVELTVWEVDQDNASGGGPAPACRVVLEGWCLLREIQERVTAVLERILAEHGLEGYRELALDYDFPLDKLHQLRQVRA
jgi:hypothetical protein